MRNKLFIFINSLAKFIVSFVKTSEHLLHYLLDYPTICLLMTMFYIIISLLVYTIISHLMLFSLLILLCNKKNYALIKDVYRLFLPFIFTTSLFLICIFLDTDFYFLFKLFFQLLTLYIVYKKVVFISSDKKFLQFLININNILKGLLTNPIKRINTILLVCKKIKK